MQEFYDAEHDLLHFDFGDVGSTNDEALTLAAERGFERCVVTAIRQLDGRGRRGRPWVSEAGNLYASFYLRKPGSKDMYPTLSYVASLALANALERLIPAAAGACQLKWPNDVLWNGAKLSGLLLETHAQSHQGVVIGIGVNVSHHPTDTPYPATDLKNEGYPIKVDELFCALKTSFFETLDLWDKGRGFSYIRKEWLAKAKGLGEGIFVRLHNEEVSGRFLDIDEQGRLIVGLPNKAQRIISAGDVFFPALAR